jgi:Ni/Co efflux regulator RcnB
MRNSLLFLLLVSAAMPAVAADDDGDRAARREARAEARSQNQADARSERHSDRAQQTQNSEPRAQVRSLAPVQADRLVIREHQAEAVRERVLEHRSQRGSDNNSGSPALVQRIVRPEQVQDAEPTHHTMEGQRDTTDSVREWRGRMRRVGDSPAGVETTNGTLGNGSFRELRREPAGRDAIGNRRGPVIGSIPRPGTQPPLPTTTRQSRTRLSSLTAQHWRNNWRTDHRYDWRNHRRHHRSLFHFGFYYDPFGWGYRHYSIGSRLWPSYYRSNFWLNDPWQYRLPYAPPGYRWIRYYDDAILIDTWDGQVVDVIYNFFW